MLEAAWSHHERLLAYVRGLVPSHEDAEDLVQELYLRVPQLLDGGDGPFYDALFPYLCGCRRRMAANRRRERRRAGLRTQSLPSSLGRASPWSRIFSVLDAQEILAMLPEDDARLLRWRFFEEWSHEEIADRMAVSRGLVRVRLHRALGRARRLLG